MGGRVVAVDPASEDRDRDATRIEGATMRLTVDPSRHPAHDDETGGCDVAGERTRHRATVRGARSRTDDSHGRPIEERTLPRAAKEELRRRVVDCREQRRERRVASPDAADCGHAAGNSPGMRYESASAT